MALIGVKAKNHPQQVILRGPADDVDDRRTPDELWLPLHEQFKFTLDAAARPWNTKLPKFCGDGLTESWAGESVWCNPPYSDIRPWVKKAWREYGSAAGVVMLLPANRTEQKWWQEDVEPFRGRGGFNVRFLPGRQRFNRPGWTKPAKGDRPPFGLALLIWENK